MDFELRANMAAAKMLGLKDICAVRGQDGQHCGVHYGGNPYEEFDIFNNPADCLETVICLLRLHDAMIWKDECSGRIMCQLGAGEIHEGDDLEHAAGAACIAVVESGVEVVG